jgi:predicted DCC family thiol-disulfide oxidoreductase YuxK
LSTPVFLYDAECILCTGVLHFVLRRDHKRTLRFGALRGEYGLRVRACHPKLPAIDSMVWLESDGGHEQWWVKSDAAIRLALYLGGWWRIATVARILPRFVRDALYDFVASHRIHWFGTTDRCLLLTPEQQARLLA